MHVFGFVTNTVRCETWSFHDGENSVRLVDYMVVQWCDRIRTFLRILLPPFHNTEPLDLNTTCVCTAIPIDSHQALKILPNVPTREAGNNLLPLCISSCTSPPRQFDHVWRFLADHVDRSHRVARRNHWHDGGVHNAKPFDPSDPQFWIHDSVRVGIGPHLARTDLVL